MERQIEKVYRTLTFDISASEEARNLLKKSKLIYIKKSKSWVQSRFYSFSFGNGKQKSRPTLKIMGLQKL